MIPEFQKLMLPILKYAGDDKIHSVRETIEIIGRQLNLTREDLDEWLPGKSQKKFYNYLYWAKAHLKMAGLLENKGRGQFQITDRGKALLLENPQSLNIKYLTDKFEDYKNTRSGKNSQSTGSLSQEDTDTLLTPELLIESGYAKIRASLLIDILDKLKKVLPSRFEEVVVQLLVKMGYGGSRADAGQAIGKSGDEGIDGIIKEDKLGLDTIYIQAKRWEGVVGRPEIQKFVGALAGQRAKKGVFITTSGFTKEAINYASQMDTKIVLIDGEKLSELMIDYNLGVSVQNTYEIKKIDSDYFEEE
ncbi:MAG TPA: restriction endonuclease [Chitinophagaceae bacterium]|jgi:restriction system protein|nr:restriction endonuclease [Chitinophagaceae bacterium]